MRKNNRLFIELAVITTFLSISGAASADQLDLNTFTPDGDVNVNGNVVTIDETSGLWSSYFYDDSFSVSSNALSFSVNYGLTSDEYDDDWLVVMVDDGFGSYYDLEVNGNNSGIYVLDLVPFRGSTISLTFGLEAGIYDDGLGSVATFSNFDLTLNTQPTDAVPEPATMLLFGTGLAGLLARSRKRNSAKPA
ncbi:PEP-CTERM sorting domain-containing protein [Desulfopila aestuarii]|uniref:PEP-CTERM protein-sorting domain-containing protein n=1 Tax=Desulfopila aestuarii DSM 18488 TaxID=1121416 RepID=A0A1M7YK37_9BACT|nr:PEP-CTERM sorting domain-containing protein [Desulfopila aestuarii]SHO52967.1 PEP-CTERM protein-sorting domain-containing protein [Desulfopila aestuarii DSM 18488]